MSRKMTEVYRMILDSCSHYEFSFQQEEVAKYLSEREWWNSRYGNDPIWR